MIRTFVITALLCFFASYFYAQSWHPFPSQGPWYYRFETGAFSDDGLHAFRIDSVTANGPDSIYHFNSMARWIPVQIPAYDCDSNLIDKNDYDWMNFPDGFWQANQDNVLGHEMIASPNGDYRFVITRGDTLSLKTNLPVGSSWAWGNASINYDSISYGSVLGQMDSLKYFSTTGGRQIILSRNFGLKTGFSFLPVYYRRSAFTDSVFNYEIWGIESMGLGKKLPEFKDYFDWSPGESWQSWDSSSSNGTVIEKFLDVRIQASNYFLGQDSVWFSVDYDQLEIPHFGSMSYVFGQNGTRSWTNDEFLPEIKRIPGEFEPNNSNNYNFCSWMGFSKKFNSRLSATYNYQNSSNICDWVMAPLIASGWQERDYTLTEGLGRTHEYYYYDDEIIDILDITTYELLCYKKLTDSAGTCEDLALIYALPEEEPATLFTLFPNPSESWFVLEGLDQEGELRITNLLGEAILTQKVIKGKKTKIEVYDWSSGIYLVTFLPQKGEPFSRKLMVR